MWIDWGSVASSLLKKHIDGIFRILISGGWEGRVGFDSHCFMQMSGKIMIDRSELSLVDFDWGEYSLLR